MLKTASGGLFPFKKKKGEKQKCKTIESSVLERDQIQVARLLFSTRDLNVVLVGMEISSTKHKCEWRTRNDIVIASSCRHLNDKTTDCSFTMAREQSCALSHKTTKAKTSTLQNPAPTPSSPWWIPPTWYKLQLFLGKLKMQMQPRSSSRSPSATPALPGSTDSSTDPLSA